MNVPSSTIPTSSQAVRDSNRARIFQLIGAINDLQVILLRDSFIQELSFSNHTAQACKLTRLQQELLNRQLLDGATK